MTSGSSSAQEREEAAAAARARSRSTRRPRAGPGRRSARGRRRGRRARSRRASVARRFGLDVDRQHAQRRHEVRGRERRIAVDVGDRRRPGAETPSIVDRGAQPAIDEIAIREAQVGLEAGRCRAACETLAERRHVAPGPPVSTRATGRAVESATQLGRRRTVAPRRSTSVAARRRYEEVRPHAVVDRRRRTRRSRASRRGAPRGARSPRDRWAAG